MTGRRPARLLAPVALVAAAIALFAVISSAGDGGSEPAAATPTPAATETPARKRDRADDEPSGKTYTVQPGDTPLEIAEQTGVDLDDLLAANPGLDANALTVGEELELP